LLAGVGNILKNDVEIRENKAAMIPSLLPSTDNYNRFHIFWRLFEAASSRHLPKRNSAVSQDILPQFYSKKLRQNSW
jgi:hypothetical protein